MNSIARDTPSELPIAPGPGNPLRTLRRLARDPLALALALQREHGDVVRLGLGRFVLVTHPRDIRHVLQDNAAAYWKGTTFHRRSGGLFGSGLLASEGALWKQRRRMLNAAFTRAALPRFVPSMARLTLEMLERWRSAREFDVKAELLTLTQNLISTAMFRSQVGARAAALGAAMGEIGGFVERNLRAPLFVPTGVPTPRNLRFRRAVATLDRALGEFVDARRDAVDPGHDLLGVLLRARDSESGQPLSPREIRDELMTLFIAGHETAASALSFGLVELARQPGLQERIADEAGRAFGDDPPDAEALMRLPFTERVVKEVLRLHPPAWMMIREAREDDELGGYRIPARSEVLISPYVTHRRPDLWDDPECFDPDRFARERGTRPAHAWVPFGAGPRVCIGQPFAMAEMKVVLALVAQRCPLALAPGVEVAADPKLTLQPRGPLTMRPRTARSAAA